MFTVKNKVYKKSKKRKVTSNLPYRGVPGL